ncbi:MAG: [FeFe] hydrogenase, group A [Spirochaetes bacterium]|nr:[FeFe] hydrogenase, group A [Spirochaetota bacterium]MBU1079983.1 [FeFe] hydrogenase, group A [Spirochaetota bacterium]
MAKLTINGAPYEASAGMTILDVCQREGIHIPTLCNHPDLKTQGICRVCVVDVKGSKTLQSACGTPVSDGMEILTTTDRIRKARKTIVELLLANHYTDCTVCPKNLNCELQSLANEFGLTDLRWKERRERTLPQDDTSPVFVRDNNKCVLCQRCVRACDELQGVYAVANLYKGDSTIVGSAFNRPISEVVCINCGQCVAHCPTGALYEKYCIEDVWKAIDDPDKIVVIQTAPAIRAALGEAFDYPPGTRVTGKMVSALRTMGFDNVFDTQFAADLTIMEEGFELLGRLKDALADGGKPSLPMMTSCSPGWIKFQEHFFPEYLPNLSTCKSPQQMFGAVVKSFWARKMNLDPADIVCVSVMPCTAKKFEAARPEMGTDGDQDVDFVLTTRELAVMIKQAGIDLRDMADSAFDDPLGESTGAATIFAATGGVMEAALRTAYEVVTGREVPFKDLDITPVRGLDGVKQAGIALTGVKKEWSFLEGVELKVMVAHGTANAKAVMTALRDGKLDVHFIEIMTCPGGCLGGGGQPLPVSPEKRLARARAIYEEDSESVHRKSHRNPSIARIYDEFFGSPNSHLAHELLHTRYTVRGQY